MGIRPDDVQYIELYNEYNKLHTNGEKVSYIYTPDHSKAIFIAFLPAYYSSDTFPLRPQEMSVDCFIIAFLVHIVPFPDNPACSK